MIKTILTRERKNAAINAVLTTARLWKTIPPLKGICLAILQNKFKKHPFLVFFKRMRLFLVITLLVACNNGTTPVDTPNDKCDKLVTVNDPDLEILIRKTLELNQSVTGNIPLVDMQRLRLLRNDVVSIDIADIPSETKADGSVSDLRGLQCANNLIELGLSGVFADLQPLAELDNLSDLTLYSDHIDNLAPLSKLTQLKRFTLIYDSNLTNIGPLINLINLTYLNLANNQIKDIEILAKLTELQTLIIYKNRIEDISALENLRGLEFLWLSENLITDISALETLTQLNQIYLYDNQISNIEALVYNTGLGIGDFINLRDNPISNEAKEGIRILRERGIEVLE